MNYSEAVAGETKHDKYFFLKKIDDIILKIEILLSQYIKNSPVSQSGE